MVDQLVGVLFVRCAAAIGMLERLLDPVARAIANAPIDDEPLTPGDEKALAQRNAKRLWSPNVAV